MTMTQLYTRWQTGDTPLGEYPRPQLRRENYQILNGLWDYAIAKTPAGSTHPDPGLAPETFEGKILVPFSPESACSGVRRTLLPGQTLYYRRSIWLPDRPAHQRLLLHFEAVDYEAVVAVNGVEVGRHIGGYTPFTLDITDDCIIGENMLTVALCDPSDTYWQGKGKQSLKPGGMFYHAQSGIWQSVWMEWVSELYITRIRMVPDCDQGVLRLRVWASDGGKHEVRICGEDIEETCFTTRQTAQIPVNKLHLWSPEDPYLYKISICLGRDRVDSYFAMRTFAVGIDEEGYRRFLLNGQLYFMNGVLDQGYWPESLMTAPSDEALIYDITAMKDLGFNMLRKHVKVESARWYYHCDRLGMLVWQDAVSGGSRYDAAFMTVLPNVFTSMQKHMQDGASSYRRFGREEESNRASYRQELKEMVECLWNAPCICTWVPFNEGWGQFEAKAVTKWLRHADPSRLVDSASGWFDQHCGDIVSIHNYFRRLHIPGAKHQCDERIYALTEYGGAQLAVAGHTAVDETYGYHNCRTEEELTDRYEKLIRRDVLPGIQRGLSAVVYTQLSDIEEEQNGLLTWDRACLKVDRTRVRKLNQMCREAVKQR